MRSHQRRLLKPDEAGSPSSENLLLPQFLLARGGSISVQVVQPRSVQPVPIDLVHWTRNFPPEACRQGRRVPTGRWSLRRELVLANDLELFVTYRYSRSREAARRLTAICGHVAGGR